VLGPDQEQWFFELVEASDHTWKVWGNEYCLAQIAVDLSGFAIPAQFQKLWYLSVDLWDGNRNRRDAIIERLADVENVVAITGDIHGFHAATPMVDGKLDRKLIELVTSSISSATFEEELNAVVDSNPALADFAAAKQLVELADFLLNSPDLRTNPHLPWSDSTRHGFVEVELDGERLEATYHRLAPAYVREDYADRLEDLQAAVEKERFRVNAGERELYRELDGTWKRWNPSAFEWE
jgi:alkaline phosphatase D